MMRGRRAYSEGLHQALEGQGEAPKADPRDGRTRTLASIHLQGKLFPPMYEKGLPDENRAPRWTEADVELIDTTILAVAGSAGPN